MSASPASFERLRIGNSNTIFKSGPLLISSKGLGWKTWKKRWFVLTRTSLVFFKSDPNLPPPIDGEGNAALGGIDLNNSGSVILREDKKLITVLFPDGRDGRGFTLKAETSEDLYDWKFALERALAQALDAALVMGNTGIFRSDNDEAVDGPFCLWRNKHPVMSIAGRPILLALEDLDGSPSFLEKALRFLEVYGVKVEGILRLSADVDEVHKRLEEYEQGKMEFNPNEDAHVIGDCVKHLLRELPSSPVPTSCCCALLEAHRVNPKEAQVNSIRTAIQEALPEPNRRLLRRVLKMMRTISSHSSENRMIPYAVAACMAPLLLPPLFSGECEFEDAHDMGGDNSALLIAAANAANNARAILTTLLEEYENIFDADSLDRSTFSSYSQTVNSGSECASDDGNVSTKINGCHNVQNYRDPEVDIDHDRRHSGRSSGISGSPFCNHNSYKVEKQGSAREIITKAPAEVNADKSLVLYQPTPEPKIFVKKLTPILTQTNGSNAKKLRFWRKKNETRTPSKSNDFSEEEDSTVQRLETSKDELQQRIAKEARGNAILQASLEKRKQALQERRRALEQDVAKLHAELQAERDLRAALEVGLSMSPGKVSSFHSMDSKTMAELEEIAIAEADVTRLKQKVAELHHQLNQQRQHQYDSLSAAGDPYECAAEPQQPYMHFDTRHVYNHDRKRTEELGSDQRNIKGQLLSPGSSGRVSLRNHLIGSTNFNELASTNSPNGGFCDLDSPYLATPSSASEMFDYPRNRSSTLVELTELATRLDFFKDRRAQLMKQLHSLDINYAS